MTHYCKICDISIKNQSKYNQLVTKYLMKVLKEETIIKILKSIILMD